LVTHGNSICDVVCLGLI